MRTGLSSEAQLQDRLQQHIRPQNPATWLPAPYIHCTPYRLSLHMEKVMDGDAITERALAQQRGVLRKRPARIIK